MKKYFLIIILCIFLLLDIRVNATPLNPEKTYWVHARSGFSGFDVWFENDTKINVEIVENEIFLVPTVTDGKYWRNWNDGNGWEYVGLVGRNTLQENGYIIDSSHTLTLPNGEVLFGLPEADVRILLPRDGFEDNSWVFTFWVESIVSNVSDVGLIDVEVRVNDSSVTSYEVTRNFGVWNGSEYNHNLNFNIEVPVGENIVSVKYKVDDEVIGEKSVMVTRLEGFIDSDGDGLDDRTGRTDINIKPIDWSGDLSNIENTDFLGAAKSLTGQVGQLPMVVSSVLSFLPREIILIMVAGFGAVVLIAIFRAIRGG